MCVCETSDVVALERECADSQSRWQRFGTVMVWAVLLYGFVARLFGLLTRESLWLDETAIAHNIVFRSITQMHEPLVYNQSAPLGFLYLIKLNTLVFGVSDITLRLLPCLFGIALLWVMYQFTKQFGRLVLLAVLLVFTASYFQLEYSIQIKQYTCDGFMAMLAIIFACRCVERFQQRDPQAMRHLIWLGVFGVISTWFSFVNIIILAGIGLTLLIFFFMQREKRAVIGMFIIGGLWLLSLGLHYAVFLSSQDGNDFLKEYWVNGFAPFPPISLSDLKWYPAKYFYAFSDPAGFKLRYAAGVLAVFGVVGLWRWNRWQCVMVLSCLPFVFLLSAMKMYPFLGRVIQYLVPLFVLLVGFGIVAFSRLLFKRTVSQTIFAAVLILMLIVPSVSEHTSRIWLRPAQSDGHDTITRLQLHSDASQLIYTDRHTRIGFEYFATLHGVELNVLHDDYSYETGAQNQTLHEQTVLKLQQIINQTTNEAWLLVENYQPTDGSPSIETRLTAYLNLYGKMVDRYPTKLGVLLRYRFDHPAAKDD